MRILVVEDEQDLNRILAKTLTAEGYSVDACFDGVEALDYLEGAEYDAIVLDVMMPRMDGFSLLAQMRESGNETPVIFLTAKDSVPDRVRGLDAGADDYLVSRFRSTSCWPGCASSRASAVAAPRMSSPSPTSRSTPPRTMSRAAVARSRSRPRSLPCSNT